MDITAARGDVRQYEFRDVRWVPPRDVAIKRRERETVEALHRCGYQLGGGFASSRQAAPHVQTVAPRHAVAAGGFR